MLAGEGPPRPASYLGGDAGPESSVLLPCPPGPRRAPALTLGEARTLQESWVL